MPEAPVLKVGSVLKDKSGNVWIVNHVNPEPTYRIVQVWAGSSKSTFNKSGFENTHFGNWSDLTSGNNGMTLIEED